MADFSAPSFSLGLDLDPGIADLSTEDEEERAAENADASKPSRGEINEGHDPELQTLVPDSDDDQLPPPRVLKRLRRGPLHPPSQVAQVEGDGRDEFFPSLDDEIEEFSSQEERQLRDTFHPSKLSLHRVLPSRSTNKLKTPIVSSASNASTLTNLESSKRKNFSANITISPVRKIQLVDSDSDDPSSEYEEFDTFKQAKGLCSSQSNAGKEKKNALFSAKNTQKEGFWKDIRLKQKVEIATPALDEFCEEYFRSQKEPSSGRQKDGSAGASNCRKTHRDDFEGHCQKSISRTSEQNWDQSHAQPPAYHYFFHADVSIQKLVRERLPHFVPLCAGDDRGNQQFGAENLDYMGQFGQKSGLSQTCANHEGPSEAGSKAKRRKPNNSRVEEASPAAGDWVNPRNNAALPRDAGKRRVRAEGQQCGHWFTGQDGKKVYVTKTGQELTGQIAYRHYRRESGAASKRAKGKTSVKKKATAKKTRRR
ncbi:hypothetical protein IHE45_08G146600 [Dioscorea alata]|uniref:Uncharacterized protein n=2 Tax=Dioscorea alata TaxID=55571 RepID=A0ACB7VNH6_DIOAL|nr:hypothetical protein IHE45_08G146600 [Dioscorea alata]KAH7675609.1 hypothetical protein IHE45_08G146600 [Dioscorea alata]